MVNPSHPMIRLIHVLDKVYPKIKPRKKRGKPPFYSEQVIVKITLVMLLKKIKNISNCNDTLTSIPLLLRLAVF